MSSCDEIRELLSPLIDGELEVVVEARVRAHVEACVECAELLGALELVADAIAPLRCIEPPSHLAADIASSPCRRWLGLLFRAVDHEIGDANLSRLLTHLEGCEPCRQTWNDLTLMHQVGEAMAPPPHLLHRCIAVRRSTRRHRVMARRTATAAAYILAVLASLVIGNPATQARVEPATEVVEKLASTVGSEVSEVAESGRGEVRVMLWRTWQWGSRQAAAAHDLLTSLKNNLTNDDDRSTPSKEVRDGNDQQ